MPPGPKESILPPLRALAAHVRRGREARGLTRAELALRSGLSPRFLAKVEAGDGNISVARLADLAEALGTTPAELLRVPSPRSPVLALVGMRGAGKSTVGRILAGRRGVPFVEMESLVREASGMPVDQVFELHGEAYYRRLEREVLGRVLASGRPSVLAASGGVVNEPTTWEMLLERATVVWLRARPEDHWRRVVAQGDRRPMKDNPDAMAQLRAMLAARESGYARAHAVIETTGRSPKAVADAVEAEIAAP